MPYILSHMRRAATATLILVLASLLLAACGGSSKSSSTSAIASASTSRAGTGSPAGRFTALRECLRKNGVVLPQRKPGQGPPPGQGRPPGGFFRRGSAGPQLPAGVTRAQLQAATRKCGGFRRGGFAGGARLRSPTFRQALAKFAACLRENGVDVPAPDTSGKGPIFDTRGLNTSSPRFRTAQAKCRKLLSTAPPPGGPTGPPSPTP
jgi:hypothetical protein